MDGNCPREFDGIMQKSANHFLLNLGCFFVNIEADIAPFVFFKLQHIVCSVEFYHNNRPVFGHFNAVNSRYFTIKILLFAAWVVLQKHDLGTDF